MDVTTLGTGAPLAKGRATVGLLVNAPGCTPLLIDTCGGFEIIDRLRGAGAFDKTLKNVIVTHRHGDHIGGAMALLIGLRSLTFFGLADTLGAVQGLMAGCFPELSGVLELHSDFVPVRAGDRREIGGFSVSFFEVSHRVPTVAVRVSHGGKTLAYSADSLPCDGLIECARGVDLFICDALCTRQDTNPEGGLRAHDLKHPTAFDAAQMAATAGAKALALVHLARFTNPVSVLAEAKTVYQGPLSVPADGSCYSL
ncbi:MAG: ribonuclease Z [Trueperaceae bacterium]|nr:MAG: ribonuclease Z [Trueperaceae bacterium]